MARRAKAKIITFNADNVAYIVSPAGEIFKKNAANNQILPNPVASIGPGGLKNDFLPPPEELNTLLDEGECLCRPDGINYETTKRLLEMYLFLEVNYVKYGEELEEYLHEEYALSDEEYEEFYENALNINKLVADIETNIEVLRQCRLLSREMKFFFGRPSNIVMSAQILRLLHVGVNNLRNDENERHRMEGEILYELYMNPVNSNKAKQDIILEMGLGRNMFNKCMEDGISHLSMMIFGLIPKERSFLDPYSEKVEGIISEIERRKELNKSKFRLKYGSLSLEGAFTVSFENNAAVIRTKGKTSRVITLDKLSAAELKKFILDFVEDIVLGTDDFKKELL